MFDSRYKRPSNAGTTVASFLLAAGIQGAAIGGIVLAGFLATFFAKKVIQQEPIELVFTAPPPPPPPPAGGGAKAEVKPKVKKPVEKKPDFVQPKEIPEEKPVETTEVAQNDLPATVRQVEAVPAGTVAGEVLVTH